MGKDLLLFFFFNYYTRISFSLILAGILRAGKTRFLGTRLYAECTPQKWSHSAYAQRIGLVFRGKTSAGAYLDGSSTMHRFFYVNQTDSVLNFARGQTLADDTCVY